MSSELTKKEIQTLKEIDLWPGAYMSHWTPKTNIALAAKGAVIIDGKYVKVTVAGKRMIAEAL